MASGAVVGALRVLLGLDTAQFDTGVKSVQGKLGVLGGVLKRFAAGFAGAFSVGGIAFAFKKITDHMEEMGAAAQRLGVPVDTLSKLSLAAKLSEVSFDQMSTSLVRLSKNLVSASMGASNDASRAFKSLGIDVSQTGITAEGVLLKLADRFSKMPDGIQKSGVALQIFSRAGQAMIPLLNQGSVAIKEMMDQAAALGIVITKETAEAADKFNDQLDLIGAVMQGISQQIVVQMLPALTQVASGLVQFAIKSDSAKTIGAAFGEVLKSMAKFALSTASEITKLGIVFKALFDVIEARKNAGFFGKSNQGEIWAKMFADIKAETDATAAAFKAMDAAVVNTTGTMSNFGTTAGEELDLVTAKAEKAKDAFAKIFLDLQQQTASTLSQAQAIGLTEGALARLNASQDVYNKLQDAGIVATASQTQQIEAQLNAISANTERLASLKSVYDTISNGLSGLADGLVSASLSAESFGQVFKQTINSIIQDLARLFVNKFLQMLLGSGFQGLFGGGVGVGGSGLATVGGVRALGGHVSRGRSVMVGERGPELWRPSTGGNIVPNSQLGANVNIIDQRTTASPPVESRTGSDGSQEFIIRDTIRKQLPGELSRIMPAQFGAKTKLQQRG